MAVCGACIYAAVYTSFKLSEKWNEAINDFNESLRFKTSHRAQEALAVCYHRIDNFERAKHFYTLVIEEEPNLPHTRYNLAVVLEELYYATPSRVRLLQDAIFQFESSYFCMSPRCTCDTSPNARFVLWMRA